MEILLNWEAAAKHHEAKVHTKNKNHKNEVLLN